MKIMIIDDEMMIASSLKNFLKMHYKHEVEICPNVDQFLDTKVYSDYDLIISDIRMPGANGFDLLDAIQTNQKDFSGEIVLITGKWNYEIFEQGLKKGALAVLEKPIQLDILNIILKKTEKYVILRKQKVIPQSDTDSSEKGSNYVMDNNYCFHSAQMKQLFEIALNLHKNRTLPILISGETGVGKEVIAKTIHNGLDKESKPFISLNCSAIPESLFETELFGYEKGAFSGSKREGQAGKFELANGGTLFLDEIGDLPLSMQPKILRVLQEKEFYRVGGNQKIKLDIRLIFATHKNLSNEVRSAKFREDLFYRISTIFLSIPPLRDRKEDIKPLVTHFISKVCRENNVPIKLFTKDSISKLVNYSWPGNVRELQNVVERAVLINSGNIISDENIILDNSPVNLSGQNMVEENKLVIDFDSDDISFAELERVIVQKALSANDNNKSQTARKLGISINRLNRKLE